MPPSSRWPSYAQKKKVRSLTIGAAERPAELVVAELVLGLRLGVEVVAGAERVVPEVLEALPVTRCAPDASRC